MSETANENITTQYTFKKESIIWNYVKDLQAGLSFFFFFKKKDYAMQSHDDTEL